MTVNQYSLTGLYNSVQKIDRFLENVWVVPGAVNQRRRHDAMLVVGFVAAVLYQTE